ncbi:MAG: Fe-S cluster assembly protein SufD, partial [Woeseiaceae bacterium]
MSSTTLNRDLFEAAVAALPADNLAPVRARAAELFSNEGFPSTKDEDWKYTNMSAATAASNDWLSEPRSRVTPDVNSQRIGGVLAELSAQIDAAWLIVHNGVVTSDRLQSLELQDGLAVSTLADSKQLPDIAVDTALSAFNAALLEDGIHVRVNADAKIERPLGILLVDDPASRTSQTRIVIEARENSALRVIEVARSVGDENQFTNAVTQIDLAAGARVDHLRLQDRSKEHIGTHRLVAQAQAESTFSHNAFDFGGSLTRNDVIARIMGSGASVNLHGLYLGAGKQHIDNHTRVEHRVGPAVSEEIYRGILNGQARGVFNGQAIVFEGADGTDANQANHNLLLSDKAEIDTKPELEIYADDVKCSHGATVGQLDEKSLFYLRTRGLDAAEATHLLTRAFAAEILASLVVEEAHEYLQALLD